MGKIKVTPCDIEGLYTIESSMLDDERGYFTETYNQNGFKEAGLNMVFVQDNQSMPMKGVLRGLHFRKQHPQGKLVCMVRGRMFDVAADLRSDSRTHGEWFDAELTVENKKQFYIPGGFAHEFLVLSDEVEFCHKYMGFYRSGNEDDVAWDDAEAGIEWSIEDSMKLIISGKDQRWREFKDTFKF